MVQLRAYRKLTAEIMEVRVRFLWPAIMVTKLEDEFCSEENMTANYYGKTPLDIDKQKAA